MEKLIQAGRIDYDEDPETARFCQDCLFACEVDSEFNVMELTVNLHVPAGSDIGEKMGLFFQAEMKKVGFNAVFEAIEMGQRILAGVGRADLRYEHAGMEPWPSGRS